MIRRHPIATLWLIATALCAGGALAQVKAPVDEESAKDIVATTVRSLGPPVRAARARGARRGGILAGPGGRIATCTNARYWVRYDNDEPAEIRQLD